MKNIELYEEENRKNLLDLNQAIKDLSGIVKDGLVKASERPEVTKVEGEVQVNTEKAVEVSNLQDVSKSLDKLSTELAKVIRENSYKPKDTIKVENISEAQQKTIKVSNLKEIQEYFNSVVNAVKNNQPIVNVTKQEIRFPTQAREAIPVRLSDGKTFYNAIQTAVSAGYVETDPLVGYQPSDIDDSSTPKYYGFVKSDGRWYIMRESSGAYRYAKGVPLPDSGGGIYSDAWTDRANLTYSYFYEVF